MRAVAINEFGGRDRMQEMEVPDPKVGPDCALIRIQAASVNPVDWKIRQGYLEQAFFHAFPLTLGWDAAGVVEKVGPAVTSLAPGDEVYAYCRKDFIGDGTYAELVSVPEHAVARKPASLDFVHAAAVPLAGLTAYQALVDALQLQPEQTVLIHAGAGGVGHFACQIALHLGATVIATARSHNHDFLQGLGAAEVIDYTQADVFESVKDKHPDGIDAVFDLLGGDVLHRSVDILRDGGRLCSITQPPLDEHFKQRGIHAQYVFVRPGRTQLRELAELFEDRRLRVELSEVVSLADARRAHELVEEGHVRGKVAIEI